MKSVLFIAPLSGPVTGMRIASEKVKEALKTDYKLIELDFSKQVLTQGINSLLRIFAVINLIIKIFKNRKYTDIVYLTLSQTIAGNLKDLIILFITRDKKQVVHLHGGGIRSTVFLKNKLIFILNKVIMKKVDCIIVLSQSLVENFKGIVSDSSKFHIVANFSENYFFIEEPSLRKKCFCDEIRIVFLSNLIDGKGHLELLEAVKQLSANSTISLDFIGNFETENEIENFINEIRDFKNIQYHGAAKGQERIPFLHTAQVFCLPTYYPYEGQPISILEAYASGCFIITTDQGGIKDIFTPGKNGSLVKKKSITDLIVALEDYIRLDGKDRYKIGLNNVRTAEDNYTVQIFMNNIRNAFSTVS